VVDFYDAVIARRSIRAYQGDPVPDDVFNRVMEAARLAPSAKNIQPWKFVVVRDPKLITNLAIACNNQQFIAQAPIVICGCADEAICYQGMGGYWNSWAVDLSIALEHIMLAAAAEGLGTCWIGSFKEAEVRRILEIPDDIKIVALTPLGYPARAAPARPRKPLAEIICTDRYA
jgi:nitroreductase